MKLSQEHSGILWDLVSRKRKHTLEVKIPLNEQIKCNFFCKKKKSFQKHFGFKHVTLYEMLSFIKHINLNCNLGARGKVIFLFFASLEKQKVFCFLKQQNVFLNIILFVEIELVMGISADHNPRLSGFR